MEHYTQGKPTRQGHKGLPENHFEEEQGLKGFFGPVSHLVRKKPSTRWSSIQGNLKPRLFDLVEISYQNNLWQRCLYNTEVAVYMQLLKVSQDVSSAFRNADGDTLYFCHKGEGVILSDYGLLNYKKGHYIVIPKCITHTVCPSKETEFFIIENKTSHFEQPDRGLLGRHALYDQNALGQPDLIELQKHLTKNNMEILKVTVKHEDELTHFTYDECIYDVVGWKGNLYPFTLHMNHIMPVMSHKVHLPPSVHTTFTAKNFVVCSFLPRPLEHDEDALKVPFYHQNIDYDEVLFYHDGDFFSRDGLHSGMMSLHPSGFAHGPHPKAIKEIFKKTNTTEYAVMLDSRLRLKVDSDLNSLEVSDYWKSWQS